MTFIESGIWSNFSGLVYLKLERFQNAIEVPLKIENLDLGAVIGFILFLDDGTWCGIAVVQSCVEDTPRSVSY